MSVPCCVLAFVSLKQSSCILQEHCDQTSHAYSFSLLRWHHAIVHASSLSTVYRKAMGGCLCVLHPKTQVPKLLTSHDAQNTSNMGQQPYSWKQDRKLWKSKFHAQVNLCTMPDPLVVKSCWSANSRNRERPLVLAVVRSMRRSLTHMPMELHSVFNDHANDLRWLAVLT